MMRLLGVVSSWILLFSWQLYEPNCLWLIDLQLLCSSLHLSKHSWTLSTVNDLITLLMRMRPSIATSNVASTLHGRRRIRALECHNVKLSIKVIYFISLLLLKDSLDYIQRFGGSEYEIEVITKWRNQINMANSVNKTIPNKIQNTQ